MSYLAISGRFEHRERAAEMFVDIDKYILNTEMPLYGRVLRISDIQSIAVFLVKSALILC
jgi:hypothetical protein